MTNQKNDILINRVANSGLITIDLSTFLPEKEAIGFDLKDYLFQELILKEKDFRIALKELDWEKYKDQHLCVFCSTDAIIPHWAYMLVATYAAPHTSSISQSTPDQWRTEQLLHHIGQVNYSQYEGQRIVIKGCGDATIPPAAYLTVAGLLQPHAQSIMYGEPCSTVPIFKRPRKLR